MQFQPVSNVVEYAHRERRRLLEYHANPVAKTQRGDLRVQHILAIQQHLAFRPVPLVEAVHTVVTANMGGLATARRPDERGDLVLHNIQRIVEQDLFVAVKKVQATNGQPGIRFCFSCLIHLDLPALTAKRIMIVNTNTEAVIRNAAPQAMACQSS